MSDPYTKDLAALRDTSAPPSMEFVRSAVAQRQRRRQAMTGACAAALLVLGGGALLLGRPDDSPADISTASMAEERYSSPGDEVSLLPADEVPANVFEALGNDTDPKVLGILEGTDVIVLTALVETSPPDTEQSHRQRCLILTTAADGPLVKCDGPRSGPVTFDPQGTGTVSWSGIPEETDRVVLEADGSRLWQRPVERNVVLPLAHGFTGTVTLTAYDKRGQVLAVVEDEVTEAPTETETETLTETPNRD